MPSNLQLPDLLTPGSAAYLRKKQPLTGSPPGPQPQPVQPTYRQPGQPLPPPAKTAAPAPAPLAPGKLPGAPAPATATPPTPPAPGKPPPSSVPTTPAPPAAATAPQPTPKVIPPAAPLPVTNPVQQPPTAASPTPAINPPPPATQPPTSNPPASPPAQAPTPPAQPSAPATNTAAAKPSTPPPSSAPPAPPPKTPSRADAATATPDAAAKKTAAENPQGTPQAPAAQPQSPPPKTSAEAATDMRNAAEQKRAAAQLDTARKSGAVIEDEKLIPHPDGKGGLLHHTGFVRIPNAKDPTKAPTIPYRDDPEKGTAIPYRDDHGKQHTIPLQHIARVTGPDGKAIYHFLVDGKPVSVPEGPTPIFQIAPDGKRFITAADGTRQDLGYDRHAAAQAGIAPREEAANKALQEKLAQGAALKQHLTEKQAQATAAQQRLTDAQKAVADADQSTAPDSLTQRIHAREERDRAEATLKQQQQQVQTLQKQYADHYSALAHEQRARHAEIGRYKHDAAESPADAQWQKDANSAHGNTRITNLSLIAEAEKKDPASAAAMRQALVSQPAQRLFAAAEKSFGGAQPPAGKSITLHEMLMQAPAMTQDQGTRQRPLNQADAARTTAQTSLGIADPENIRVTRSADGSYSLSRPAADGSGTHQPFATLDPKTNRITLTPGPDGQFSQAAANLAASGSPDGTPIYLPGTQPPYSESQVSDLFKKGLAATTSTTDRKAADAALTQAGLTPEGISQLVQQGRISVQDGQLLNNKFNSGREAKITPHASPQGFGAWVTDESNPRSQWWRNGTDEQKAVAVHEYFDALAAGRTGDGHTTPEGIENLRRQALGDIRPEWGKPGTTTPGQDRKNGAARFESIPLKDGTHTLLPGGKWTVEDLGKLHENPVFAKATQAERDAVMNHVIGQSFTDYSHRPGFDQAAYQRFNQIAQQARDKSAALKTWSDTGADAKNFGGNVVGGVVRPIIATATDLSAKDPNNEWRTPLGNVTEQAGYWGQKAKDTVQGFLPEARAAKSKLGSDLESLHQDLINGNFPLNDRAKLDEWLAAHSKGLTDSQKAWYEAVQGKPDTSTDKGLSQHIYTHANSLLSPANAELVSKFIQTRDPAVWDELHRNLTRTPQRAETEQAQQKSLEESKIVNFMTQNYGGGDYAEHMQSAGNPIDIASNLLPMVRGVRAGKAAAEAAVLAGKSTLKGSAAALAKSAAINLGTGGVQTLVENPDATFADLAQAGKENIATALGLHAVGHVAGKAKALVTDLDAPRKARQVIDNLGAPNRQNTFNEAVQLHEAEGTLAAAQKAHLEKKQSDTGPLTQEESSTLDKANATLARHAPRDRGPLPAIPDARRDIQDLSAKAAAVGTLNADEAHQLAHAQRAIAQQRVNDLTALGTALTPQQQRQLAQFQKILNASPYGTELPKGPPPGYDPHATNPAHKEWHPPHGDKPVHPATEKFTPKGLAIPEEEVKTTTDRLKSKGHAHDRHGPEVTEGQLSDRAMHGIDPITQTKEDGERSGNDHNYSRHATQFTSERAMTQAVKSVESSAEYKDELNKAEREGKDRFTVKNVPLESALGPNYQEHVRGRTRTGSAANPSGSRLTNLTDGKTLAQYKRDPVTGKFYLNTIFATPSLTHEPN